MKQVTRKFRKALPKRVKKTIRKAERLAKLPFRKTRAAILRKSIRLDKDSARFVAHRGLSDEAPENTVCAFKLAAARRFHSMETDIRRTKDHRLVLMHDESLMRMCGVDQKVGDLTFEELSRIPVTGGNNIEKYKSDPDATRVPELYEYLEICKESGMVPMMELKDNWNVPDPLDDEYLESIADEVTRVMGDLPVIFVSFNLGSLTGMQDIYKKKNLEQVTFFHLVKRIDLSRLHYYIRHGINLSIQGKNNKLHAIREAKQVGIELVVWTVNNQDQARIYVRDHVDWIASNKQLWND